MRFFAQCRSLQADCRQHKDCLCWVQPPHSELVITSARTSLVCSWLLRKTRTFFLGRNELNKTTNVIAPTLREQQTALPASAHQRGMKAIHMQLDKMVTHLRSFKDSQPLTKSGIYKIPCTYGRVYIGETGCHISTRTLEHTRNTRLGS
jgi:hypothetical protein